MYKDTSDTFLQRLTGFIGSRRFFHLIIIAFALQALWIALSGKYPMAFDEDFHLGVIRLYAHHLSPFWSSHPAGGDAFGAVSRDPSYLYHYFMSFPYRLISDLTNNQTVQVIVLRLINIALLATSLPLFRRLLVKAGASVGLANVCLALFVLVPIVPLLGAQINYDNLFIPLTALVLLSTVRFSEQLRADHTIPLKTLLQLVILLLLTSLVKYAFLPIVSAIVVYVAVELYRFWRPSGAWRDARRQFRGMKPMMRGSLVVGLVLFMGLFGERYGVNLVRYHEPVPDCGSVLSVQQCSSYGPWLRDYDLANSKAAGHESPVLFMRSWVYGMWLRSFFAVDGPGTLFQSGGPLVLPGLVAAAAATAGVPLVVIYWRRLFSRSNRPVLGLIGAVSLTYIVVLWLNAFAAFGRTGQPVAINGRYLLPVLLPIMLVVGMAYREWLRNHPNLKAAGAVILIVCFVWGGGALTYILRSNDAWYWPSPVVHTANHVVKRTFGPLTPGNDYPAEFLQ
ncbi:MAG: hypothetical protein ABI602_02515 [Candidatus Saccharibacteria bacterium]